MPLTSLLSAVSTSPDGDIALRFAQVMDLVEAKLVKLVASAPLLLIAILVVILSAWLGGFVSRRLRLLTRISRSNPYMDGLLRNTVKILITLAGVLVALDLLGATSLVGAVLGSAGVVGLVLGFAFKDIAENYIAGVLLSLRKPFAPGDSVRIDTHEGRIVALSSRATILMTADGNHLQLPNAQVFKSVLLNYSRNPKRRFEFEVAVDARASSHVAMETGVVAVSEVDGVIDDPPPNALIRTLTNDGTVLQFTGWVDQTRNDLGRTRSEAMRRVRKALLDAGISPPDVLQKVVIARVADEATHVPETEAMRDTSVDRGLDAQVGHARSLEHADDGDLLDPPATPSERPQSP